MKTFTCDSCGDVFPNALDEIFYKDEHGIGHVFDLCAPCRKKIKDKQEKSNKDVLGKLVKEDN
jgi:hypothetical protein